MAVNNGSTDPYPTAPETKGTAEAGAESLTGDGGDNLDVYSLGRFDRLSEVANGDYSAETSFSIGPGIGNSSTNPYPGTVESFEAAVGQQATGITRDGNNQPLSGTASISLDGESVAEKSVTGQYQISAGPSEAVTQGADGASAADFVFSFTPDSGFAFEQSVGPGATVIDVIYGTVNGTVTDYNGDPVENDDVTGRLQSTGEEVLAATGPGGSYRFDAPGGSNITVIADDLNADSSTTVSQLSTTTLDFQYSGLEVTLQNPNGTSQRSAPVSFGNFFGTTNENGRVTFVQVPVLTNIDVTIYETATEAVQTGGQGVLQTVTITLGVGVTGQVTFAGQPIANVSVEVEDEDGNRYKATSQSNGSFSVGSPNAGALRLLFGTASRRYATTSVEFTAEDGDTVIENASLERRENIGTY